MKIRQAHISDLADIVQFNIAIAAQTEGLQLDAERVRRGVAAVLADGSKGVYFVAEVDSVVAGQLLITREWSDWRSGDLWWIQSVYVKPDFRGCGVFRALFEHVRAMAQTRSDVCGLRLYMDAHNARARAAYEKLGMKRTNYEIYEIDFVLPARE